MPIDLPALRARAAAIAEQFAEPPALAAAVHSLLEDYADRSHRPSQKITDSAPPNVIKTPMPVVRAVITARPNGKGTSSQGLDNAYSNFERLSPATAQRVMRFWQAVRPTGAAAR